MKSYLIFQLPKVSFQFIFFINVLVIPNFFYFVVPIIHLIKDLLFRVPYFIEVSVEWHENYDDEVVSKDSFALVHHIVDIHYFISNHVSLLKDKSC